jgi:hypothetical protein
MSINLNQIWWRDKYHWGSSGVECLDHTCVVLTRGQNPFPSVKQESNQSWLPSVSTLGQFYCLSYAPFYRLYTSQINKDNIGCIGLKTNIIHLTVVFEINIWHYGYTQLYSMESHYAYIGQGYHCRLDQRGQYVRTEFWICKCGHGTPSGWAPCAYRGSISHEVTMTAMFCRVREESLYAYMYQQIFMEPLNASRVIIIDDRKLWPSLSSNEQLLFGDNDGNESLGWYTSMVNIQMYRI